MGFELCSDADLERIVQAAIKVDESGVLDVEALGEIPPMGEDVWEVVRRMASLRGLCWQSKAAGVQFLKIERELDQEEAGHETA